MTLQELREQKRRLENEARGKLALINDKSTPDEQRTIETAHADLLQQIQRLAADIATREADEEGDAETRKGKRKRKAKGKSGDDDDADDDDAKSTDAEDEDDDDDADDGEKKKRKKRKTKGDDDDDDAGDRVGTVLSRAAMAEMVVIDTQARGLGVDLKLAEAITRNEGPDTMRKRLFDELAKKSKGRGPGSSVGPAGLEVIRDENEGRRGAMEVALITRILASRGREGVKYEPKNLREKDFVEQHRAQAQQYQSMGFVEIAAECIGYRGRGIITAGAAIDILTRAFESTSDFPNIFENVLNKSLLARYELIMPTYREVAIERPFNAFRPHPQIRAGEFPALQPVSETGELKYGSSADTGENVSVLPYGVVFTISRQMLVNDDLGAIDQILGSAGDAVLVFENTTFFTMFNSNPVLLQDNAAVFAAGHNNLVAGGSGAAPSVITIGSARQALRGMKSISGLYLNVPPRIILTGPAQETVADQMVTAITPTLTTSVNPFSGRLRSVSDANITDTSWYICAEPGRVPCFVYGFLNGANGPRVRTFEPFGVQGVKVSLEHDFGCGAIDYRGFYKNAGD